MSPNHEAIPTVYRGVQMRSRAEADMARLLDLLKIKWQYESTSVLLPDGQHYRPDFILPPDNEMSPASWIEVRGYLGADSIRQINAVARNVAAGNLACRTFVCVTNEELIGPNCATFIGTREYVFRGGCDTRWHMQMCRSCGAARPAIGGFLFDLTCRRCHSERSEDFAVKIVNGYVSIANLDSWEAASSVRVRDIQDGADMLQLASSLPVDYLKDDAP